MDPSKQPGINCHSIHLRRSSFERFANDGKVNENEATFEYEVNNVSDLEAEASMECRIVRTEKETGEKVASLQIEFVGHFKAIEGAENMDLKKFMKYNAPAMLLPYVRQHAHDIFVRAGLTAFILPPMNLKAFIDEAVKKGESSKEVPEAAG